MLSPTMAMSCCIHSAPRTVADDAVINARRLTSNNVL